MRTSEDFFIAGFQYDAILNFVVDVVVVEEARVIIGRTFLLLLFLLGGVGGRQWANDRFCRGFRGRGND